MRLLRIQLAILALCAAAGLTGCQVISGSQYTQVRFIEASPDTPGLDIYQNGSALLYNVGPGTASSYIPVPPGAYSFAANVAGLHQQVAAASATLTPGSQYTVLVGNTTAALQMSILKDQATAPPGGQVALRFLHQATRSAAVDLYLVPPGGKLTGATPIAAGVTFGNGPLYLNAPSGTYSIVALLAGANPASNPTPLYTGTQLEYPSGSTRTIILIDPQAPATTGLQLLTANDYDAPNT